MKHQLTKYSTLVAASCLSLALGIQAFAESEMQQLASVSAGQPAFESVVEQDAEVNSAGCTDSCCGDSCGGSSCKKSCYSGTCGNGRNCCCEAVCCPKRVTEDVKKHCWLVKPELVCIPGFRFQCNWNRDKCCNRGDCCDTCTGGDGCCSKGSCCECSPLTCGRVRCVNVLEKHEYKCDECGYEWEAKCVRTGNGCCRSKGGCNCPSCGSKNGCCAASKRAATDVQLTSAE